MAPRARPPTAVRPSEAMPGVFRAPAAAAPRARGPARPWPARARGVPEVARGRGAAGRLEGTALAARYGHAACSGSRPRLQRWTGAWGPAEPGARGQGRWGGGAALPGRPRASRVSGSCSLPALGAAEGKKRERLDALVAHHTRQCPLAPGLLRIRLKGQRGEEEKGKIKRKRRGERAV